MENEAHGTEKPGSKSIVLCCDGTGNKFIDDPDDPKNSNSNVVKLYTTLKIDNEQVGYYHPGVGTAGDPAAKRWMGKQWSKVKGLAFAAGFKDNVLDAYHYLMETYNDGDRVYLIGFSRGAYTVRALAGLLDGYGLLCKGNEGHMSYAWNDYVGQHNDRTKHRVQPNKRFKETFSRKGFRIHFVGIWDTVSSVGWITTPLRLFSVARNPTVKIARHAISIDERRCFYRDNLFLPSTLDELQEVASTEDPYPTQDIRQVWFPGVHSDIGGSYAQDESVLSNNALRWLLSEAEKAEAGLVLKPQMKELVLGEKVTLTGELETDRKLRALQPLYKAPTRQKVHRSMKGPWWVLEVLPHRYYDLDDQAENWRTPLGMRRRICPGELIHQSAMDLLASGRYRPANLVGGADSLMPSEVAGLYRYTPPVDKQPARNERWTRWGVMAGVSVVDLAVLGLATKGVWWLGRRVLEGSE